MLQCLRIKSFLITLEAKWRYVAIMRANKEILIFHLFLSLRLTCSMLKVIKLLNRLCHSSINNYLL